MSKSNDAPAVLTGLHITNANNGPAIDLSGSTMTINTQATIQMGSVVLTEEKMLQFEAALEFIERFVQEDERAKAIWTAIKAKKRILG